MTPDSAGYAHPRYAASLAEWGEPVALPRSGGSVLARTIPGSSLRDAVGPYPLLGCARPDAIDADLAALRGLVSVVGVPDPLSGFREDVLRRAFPDLCRPYKTHHLADLSVPEDRRIAAHHRRRLRKAPAALVTERADDPAQWLDEWASLYDVLAARHGITGISRFSRASFAVQMTVPGISAFRARLGGETMSMSLWFRDGDRCWYHLGATSDAGYEAGAAHAVMRAALAWHAAAGCATADLGGAAGLAEDPDDGLARFKRGWCTGTAVAFLCGRILDRPAYERLCLPSNGGEGGYFPAYRTPAPPASESRRDSRAPTGSGEEP